MPVGRLLSDCPVSDAPQCLEVARLIEITVFWLIVTGPFLAPEFSSLWFSVFTVAIYFVLSIRIFA